MSQELPHEFLSSLRTSRIEALSDGIFAIAMTLLIFQIEVPDLHGSQVEAHLSLEVIQLQTLLAIIPPGIYLVAIALSFLSTLASVIVYAIVPAVYIVVPHFFSRHHRQRT